MESNKVADEVRMKLLGRVKCDSCGGEVEPIVYNTPHLPRSVCPSCGCMLSILDDMDSKDEDKVGI